MNQTLFYFIFCCSLNTQELKILKRKMPHRESLVNILRLYPLIAWLFVQLNKQAKFKSTCSLKGKIFAPLFIILGQKPII